MFTGGVKPRTHLVIDALLLVLMVAVALSGFLMETTDAGAPDETDGCFMLHAAHEVAGGAACLAILVHVLVHLTWIRSQLSRLFRCQGQDTCRR